MQGSRPQAVLWDFDGTLVDSHPAWFAAERGLAERLGGTWTLEQSRAIFGHAVTDGLSLVMAANGGNPGIDVEALATELGEQVHAELADSEPNWRPGARELLARLRADQIPCALVSASYQSALEAATAFLPDGTFGSLVGGDKVEQGKPHAEPYLTACIELGVEPAQCLVIEDTTVGASAGEAAGCTVLVPRFMQNVEAKPGRVFVDSLEGLDVDRIAELWHAAKADRDS